MREEKKKRHGCLTTWLIIMLILSSFAILGELLYIFGKNLFREVLQNPAYTEQVGADQLMQLKMLINTPNWFYLILIGFAIFNIVCAVALFTWRKWGFWGYMASNIITLAINIIFFSTGMLSLISGIATTSIMILVLLGVLHIGKENKGWPQLR